MTARRVGRASVPAAPLRPTLAPTVLRGLGVAVLYAVLAWGSLNLFATLNSSASPVWPPTGVALAALLLWGRRMWPAILVGAFAANLATTGTPVASLAIAVGNAMEALLAAHLVQRYARGPAALQRSATTFLFLGFALVAPVVSATVGATVLAQAGLLGGGGYAQVWATWYLGDVTGAIIVTPLILLAAGERRGLYRLPRVSPLEMAAMAATVIAVAAAVFTPWTVAGVAEVPLTFTVLPLVVWAALRLGSMGAASATLLMAGIAAWGTLQGHGPFTGSDPNTGLLLLQLFMLGVSTAGLALGAVVRERRDADEERAKAQAAETRFRALLEAAPDGVVVVAEDGTITMLNGQAEAMFGYSRDELLGKTMEVLVPERHAAQHPAHRARYVAHPKVRPMGANLDLAGRRKDGSEFPVEISLSPLRTPQGLLVFGLVRDISERRRLQGELDESRRQLATSEKLAALGTMVSGVAHEVRTPLTYVNTNLSLIRIQVDRWRSGQVAAEAAAAEIERLVAKNREGVQRIDRIIQQLRHFAKAELQTEPVDLQEVIAGAIEMFQSVRQGKVAVVADLRAVGPCEVDKGQLQQVLLNLLHNGAEAMGGGGELRVALHRGAEHAEIHVEDHGPGIPPDVQRRLFDPFFTTKDEGTGLGLPISRRIVEAHGGTITYRTGPAGTTFIVTLPCRHARGS